MYINRIKCTKNIAEGSNGLNLKGLVVMCELIIEWVECWHMYREMAFGEDELVWIKSSTSRSA